jgi:hypothetical protein
MTHAVTASVQIICHTAVAIMLVCCIAVVERVQVKLLGKNAVLLHIPIAYFIETAHLAVFIAWTLECIVTAYALVRSFIP